MFLNPINSNALFQFWQKVFSLLTLFSSKGGFSFSFSFLLVFLHFPHQPGLPLHRSNHHIVNFKWKFETLCVCTVVNSLWWREQIFFQGTGGLVFVSLNFFPTSSKDILGDPLIAIYLFWTLFVFDWTKIDSWRFKHIHKKDTVWSCIFSFLFFPFFSWIFCLLTYSWLFI